MLGHCYNTVKGTWARGCPRGTQWLWPPGLVTSELCEENKLLSLLSHIMRQGTIRKPNHKAGLIALLVWSAFSWHAQAPHCCSHICYEKNSLIRSNAAWNGTEWIWHSLRHTESLRNILRRKARRVSIRSNKHKVLLQKESSVINLSASSWLTSLGAVPR